jgi:multifunctional beta-oxidation protein
MPFSFKNHTVVITGAGGGLGKAYSLLFASRGANIVVNDFNGEAAQKVVDEIVKAGGKAVVNTSSVANGAAVIQSALDAFGGVTILINNAGILRDKGFKNMTDKEWDQVIEVHLKGAFSCTKAAWPHFRKQKFGRVINTASAAGLYGNFGQANYSAAKMGLVAFSKTLAIEGAKYGIKSVCIAPLAASAMTETVMPPEMLANLKPDLVAPFVAAVSHPDGPDATGKVFEVGAGYIAEIRWERSNGTVFKTDASFTPSAVKSKWAELTDFSAPYYPASVTDVDSKGKLEIAAKLPPNVQSSPEVRYDGKTVIITGAGAGLGRVYAHMFGKLGANVVVNDVSEKGANTVVAEVQQGLYLSPFNRKYDLRSFGLAGGKAAAAICSAEDGDAIVKVALEKFGGVHILIANAGVLRDKSFQAMTEQEWDLVMAVHLRGTYKCAKAVWPIFQKQKYGRIVTTCSQVGIYGNFGQANYSTAKAGIIGLTRTLAIEGKKYNILANVIAPSAGTAMTMTVWPQEMVDAFKPDFIAPLVGYLSSSDNEETSGDLFEVLGGWAAQTRWQRAGGYGFPIKKPLTPEDVAAKWANIVNFSDGRATHPATTQEALQQVIDNFGNEGSDIKAKL